jgi:hypothetical protein
MGIGPTTSDGRGRRVCAPITTQVQQSPWQRHFALGPCAYIAGVEHLKLMMRLCRNGDTDRGSVFSGSGAAPRGSSTFGQELTTTSSVSCNNESHFRFLRFEHAHKRPTGLPCRHVLSRSESQLPLRQRLRRNGRPEPRLLCNAGGRSKQFLRPPPHGALSVQHVLMFLCLQL